MMRRVMMTTTLNEDLLRFLRSPPCGKYFRTILPLVTSQGVVLFWKNGIKQVSSSDRCLASKSARV